MSKVLTVEPVDMGSVRDVDPVPAQRSAAEPDDQEAGADLNLSLPFDKGYQQCEGEDHQEHCQQMADR